MKRLISLAGLLSCALLLYSQDAERTMDRLLAKMNRIENYSADVLIKSDIPLVKILPVRATVYFKQKDKFRIVSKGIALLPRQGFIELPKLMEDPENYSRLFAGYDTVAGIRTEIITIMPLRDTSDLILAKLWIDSNRELMLKSQVTTRSNGTVLIEYFHSGEEKFGLPDSIVFTVDVRKFKIPKGVATDINRSSARNENAAPARNGKIFLRLYNYKINEGISDAIFNRD
jgi:hypothetical protein